MMYIILLYGIIFPPRLFCFVLFCLLLFYLVLFCSIWFYSVLFYMATCTFYLATDLSMNAMIVSAIDIEPKLYR